MPSTPSAQLLRNAFELHQAGRLDEARAAYVEFLQASPDHPAALNNFGALLLQQGAFDQACAIFEKLCALGPDNPIAHANLGYALLRAGRPEPAIAPLAAAVHQQPTNVDAHNHLGLALLATGDRSLAATHFRTAAELAPARPEALSNLCDLWIDDADFEQPQAFLRRLLSRDASNVAALYKLGYVLMLGGELEEARSALTRVAELAPGYAPTLLNLGTLSFWTHDLAAAERYYRDALALQPGYVEAAENLSHVLLANGNFREGWKLFEARRGRAGARRSEAAGDLPMWDGRDDPRATLLVTPEQGLGDVIQFARFLARARRRVGRLVLVLDGYWAPLRRLLQSLEGVDQIVDSTSTAVMASAFCPLLSLPFLLDIAADDIAGSIPYLDAPAEDQRTWCGRLSASTALQVGLCWVGGSQLDRAKGGMTERRRSLSLDALAPLLHVPGVRFHSLQQFRLPIRAAGTSPVVDWSAELVDMTDTAALIAQLDLVISVDSAIVHLAGALGKPVWMLNRFDSDWRWGVESHRSPWYPTLRIFRQRSFGDWMSAIEGAARALLELAAAQSKREG